MNIIVNKHFMNNKLWIYYFLIKTDLAIKLYLYFDLIMKISIIKYIDQIKTNSILKYELMMH